MASTWLAAILVAMSTHTAVASTVKLASGETIEGEIQGRLLIKRGVQTDPAFRVVEGKDIATIDQHGVTCLGDSVIVTSLKEATATELLKALMAWDQAGQLKKNQGLTRKVGGHEIIGIRVDNSRLKPVAETLLGEYHVDRGTKMVEPTGSIRVKKADGDVVTVLVKDIVAFEEPTPPGPRPQ